MSGRLGKVARSMKWNEREAGGALWFFYQHTQEAGIVAETIDHIITAIIPDFDSDEQAKSFVEAMISARLATRDDSGVILIHGNEEHVKRLGKFYDRARKGGEARQKQISEKLNDVVSHKQPQASLPQLQASTPSSLLPAPSSSAPSLRESASEGDTSLAGKARENLPAVFDHIETTVEAIAMKVPPAEAIEIVEFYRTESIKKNRATGHPPMILPRDMLAARMVIALSGGSLPIAKTIIGTYLSHDANKFWKDRGWPLPMIAQPKDFEQAQAIRSKKPVSKVRNISEETV